MSEGPYRKSVMLASGPREVPFGLRARLYHLNWMSITGWAEIAFGMVFVWVFAMQSDLSELWAFDGKLERAPAVVIDSRATAAKVNRSRVYSTDYRFTVDGVEYRGRSYARGGYRQAGARVEVEYPAGKPDHSRIVGMSTSLFGPWGTLAGLAPLPGLVFLMFGLRRGRRSVTLLRQGKVTDGKLVSRQGTSVRINGRMVYKLTFQFQADDGKTYYAEARTHRTEVLTDEPTEQLVYHPSDPRFATLIDHLPGTPRINENGQIEPRTGFGTTLAIALPFLATVPHLIVYLALFV